MTTYVQSFPGIPDCAANSQEFAIDRPALNKILTEDLAEFCKKNPVFEDVWQTATAGLDSLVAARIFMRDKDGTYRYTPGCPSCRRPHVMAFVKKFCAKFQVRFMAAWSDPGRRSRMINDLVAYFLAKYPEIEEKNLELVVNVHRMSGEKQRCILYSRKGANRV